MIEKTLSLGITRRCSLRCPYCVANKHLEGSQIDSVIDEIGIEKYMERLKIIVKPYENLTIRLSGEGEPSESKYFVRIASDMFKLGYKISIQTNLHGIHNIIKFLRCG